MPHSWDLNDQINLLLGDLTKSVSIFDFSLFIQNGGWIIKFVLLHFPHPSLVLCQDISRELTQSAFVLNSDFVRSFKFGDNWMVFIFKSRKFISCKCCLDTEAPLGFSPKWKHLWICYFINEVNFEYLYMPNLRRYINIRIYSLNAIWE